MAHPARMQLISLFLLQSDLTGYNDRLKEPLQASYNHSNIHISIHMHMDSNIT